MKKYKFSKVMQKIICSDYDPIWGQCFQPIRLVTDKTKEPVAQYNERNEYIGDFYPSKKAKDGLCYYHHKKRIGRFG